MDIFEEEPADVYTDYEILDCDSMPAAHKLSGTAGHSHDMHPCLYCDANITKVNTREGFDYSIISSSLHLCCVLDPCIIRLDSIR